MTVLNDVQSRLNATEMLDTLYPASPEEVAGAIARAATLGAVACPAGALHSMGGQQFATGGISISSSSLKEIGPLDRHAQSVWVQSGVTWPELVAWLQRCRENQRPALTIIQKQTGADEFSLGGALSSNIHGRVLGRKPLVDDILGFHLTTGDGRRLYCSREENPELFGLAIGGYGLFGLVDSIHLKLTRREQVVRRVRELDLEEVIPALEGQIEAGATFGDFQYMTDEASKDFMSRGIMSTYSPTDRDGDIPAGQLGLSTDEWLRLYILAHTDKGRAYREYVQHYLQTDGQIYWSDDHQFSPYLPEAGDLLYRRMGWQTYASLVITELYFPRDSFVRTMQSVRQAIKRTGANVVYGTVRLIEAEEETLLRWARQDYACVIFNLLVEHTPDGLDQGKAQFQALIDCALNEGGSYYLTYHRWARRDQALRAYPEFPRFLQRKQHYDPRGLFDSDWHRHYRKMLL